jgi:hypothetical protein
VFFKSKNTPVPVEYISPFHLSPDHAHGKSQGWERKKGDKGLFLTASWTWSKALYSLLHVIKSD